MDGQSSRQSVVFTAAAEMEEGLKESLDMKTAISNESFGPSEAL